MKKLILATTIFLSLFASINFVYAAITPGKINNNDTLKNGLVGYWSFDGPAMQGSSTALDLSGNNNYGYLKNGPAVKTGKIGQALSFDGVNAYVETSDLASVLTGEPLTISAWVKTPNLSQVGGVVSVSDVTDDDGTTLKEWVLVQVNGEIWALSQVSNTSAKAIATIPAANTWFHVVGVFTNSASRSIYLNGVFVQTETTSRIVNPAIRKVRVGKRGANIQQFNGLIDDVRVYNRALSADEIKRLYRMGATLKLHQPNNNDTLKNGLVGYWTFDGPNVVINGGVLTALDDSGNGKKATTTGTKWPKKITGKIGQAFSFDGVDDSIISESAPVTAVPVTLCAWFKSGNITNEQTLVTVLSRGGSNSSAWALELRGDIAGDPVDALSMNSIAFPVQARSTSSYKINTWHHACGVFRSNTSRSVYFNGVLENTETTNNAPTAIDRAVVGAMVRATSVRLVTGSIDDVRIYNRALSADEIKRLYRMGATLKLHQPNNNDTLKNGLVGYWSFDGSTMQGSSTALDLSGNNNYGYLKNGPAIKTGKIGQALLFDGVNDYINAGNDSSLNISGKAISVSAWIYRLSAQSNWPVLVHKESGSAPTGGYVLFLTSSTGIVSFRVRDSSNVNNTADSATSLSIGKWYHIVGTYDGSNVNMFLNGVKDGNSTASTLTIGTTNLTFGIGNDTIPQGTYFNGLIDDVRVYNRALSADEIKRLYNMGR